MTRAPYQAKSCATCRAKKVKCDKIRPICIRCKRAGRPCEGRYQDGSIVYLPGSHGRKPQITAQAFYKSLPGHSFQRRLQSPSSGAQNRIQLISTFLSEYFPQQSGEHSAQQASFSWVELFPLRLGRCLFLDIALAALSLAFIGKKYGDGNLIYKSQECYTEVVAKVQILSPSMEARHLEHLIDTSMVLANYELYNCTPGQTNAWMVHVNAACRLLEECGPDKPLDEHLFRRVRTLALYDSCARRRSTFLANPEWCAVIPSHTRYDQLLDILMHVPSILEVSDETKRTLHSQGTVERSQYQQLLYRFTMVETLLWEWYLELLTLQNRPLFVSRRATPDELSLLRNDPDLVDVFPNVIEFSSRYVSQLLLLSWLAFVILYNEAVEIMRTCDVSLHRPFIQLHDVPSNKLNQSFNHEITLLTSGGPERGMDEIEKIAGCFAARLCQVVPCPQTSTYGSAILQTVMVVLWMVQQFFRDRSPDRFRWCQTVLGNLQQRGFAYSAELTGLSYEGYLDIVRKLSR